ncbi:hypothetical protein [Bacteroides sp.]|uniref:hypothetical protein n=1 Tax=Bacteroides sp. TaxID=29523 RepID=UPI0025878F81|nr:hypothetical protein [Bacteroides sp.]
MTKSPPLIDIWQFIAYAVCTIAYPKIMNTTPDMAVKIGSLFFVFNIKRPQIKEYMPNIDNTSTSEKRLLYFLSDNSFGQFSVVYGLL